MRRMPEILMGIGIAGMLATAILAVKATPKAVTLIEERKKETGGKKMPVTDLVRTVGRCYIPAILTCSVSLACLIGANSIHARRFTMLALAYRLSESAAKEYRDKVMDVVGKQKERSVRDSLSKDYIEKNPMNSRKVIITGKGNTLFYDVISKRYFLHDAEKLRKAQHNLNLKMKNYTPTHVSLNDWYYAISLPPADNVPGDNLFWDTFNLIDMMFSTHLTERGTQCTVIGFRNPPSYALT